MGARWRFLRWTGLAAVVLAACSSSNPVRPPISSSPTVAPHPTSTVRVVPPTDEAFEQHGTVPLATGRGASGLSSLVLIGPAGDRVHLIADARAAVGAASAALPSVACRRCPPPRRGS
jgi:hypothetical protein